MKVEAPWYGLVAREGTRMGDYLRDQFIANVLDICGDVRLFYLPRRSETTTSTDRSRNALVITYDATAASRYNVQGTGVSVTFDGTDDEADTPDVAGLSFGDSVNDQPMSIVAWVNQTATTGIKAIASKFDIAGTLREYQLVLDAAEKLRATFFDESSDGTISRLYNTALATGSMLNVAVTYDGSRAVTGVKLYSAAARVDDTDNSSGTYTAMENTATVGRIGSSGSGTAAEFFNGSIACVLVVAKELSLDELWQLKNLGNAFFDLAL